MFQYDDLLIEIIDVLYIERKKQRYIQPKRPFHVLSKRVDGSSDFFLANNSVNVSTDKLLYIPANTEYKRHSIGNETLVAIHFNILNRETSEPALIDIDTDECNKAFYEIYQIWCEKRIGYKYKCSSLLYDFLSKSVIEKSKSKEYYKLQKSIEYIHNNLSENIKVDTLSAMCGLCNTQYRKLFYKEFDITPVKYINKLRIESAISKIYAGVYSMGEIAELCGFSDQKYFNKIFKIETGKSPSQYKKENFPDSFS